MAPPRILVTGFEPNDDGLNASQVVVASLISDVPPALESLSDCLRFAILPGNTNILTETIVALIDDHQPGVCLLVGQAPGRSKVTFERVATNLRDFMVADRAGNVETGSRIFAEAPAAYFSTLDAPQLAKLVESTGIPAAPSNHAVNHLCNQALFVALHYAATRDVPVKSVFMHIPLLPSQVDDRWVNHPTMPFAILRNAVTRTICYLADAPLIRGI